ncbi:MAG: hypothetical protein H6631_17450 [Anaerolineaceae bacterium]|nr:hypothetical protein [Anaerolineaceae bacterium]MCB9100617.1 hypothetical protein [Anaerolineales bacterium]
MTTPPPQEPNTLGKTSLSLSIVSIILVFSIGLCSFVARSRGLFPPPVRTAFFVIGGISGFVGFLGMVLGLAGLFGGNRQRATAVAGLVLGIAGLLIFVFLWRVGIMNFRP